MAVTPNLGLHQWAAGDSFLREDFNGDFGKIDAVIGRQLKIVTGSFTTDGTNSRAVTLGFRPKVLLVFGKWSASGGPDTVLSVVFDELCYCDRGNYNSIYTDGSIIQLTDSGFVVKSKDYFNYQTGNTTYYLAFRE